MLASDYEGALKYYETVEYGDSTTLAAKCHYELGRTAHMMGNIEGAVAEYAYATSLLEVQESLLAIAKDYATVNEIEKAIQTLWLIRENTIAKEMLLEIGKLKAQSGDKEIALLANLSVLDNVQQEIQSLIANVGFSTFEILLQNCVLIPEELQFIEYNTYNYGFYALSLENYEEALAIFAKVENYENAKELYLECCYCIAKEYEQKEYYKLASEYYLKAEGYLDAQFQYKKIIQVIEQSPKYLISGKNGYGYCNEKGEIIIPCQWVDASRFSDGIAMVKSNDDEWGVINLKGEYVLKCQYFEIRIHDGYIQAYPKYDYQHLIVYDKEGNIILPYEYYHNLSICEGGITYNKDSCIHYYNFTSKKDIEYHINHPSRRIEYCYDGFHDGLLCIFNGFINMEGKVVYLTGDDFSVSTRYYEGMVKAYKEDSRGKNLVGFADTKGKLVIPCKWDYYSGNFNEGFARVINPTSQAKCFIDKKGKVLNNLEFKDAKDFSEGLAAVQNSKNLWGFIDQLGNLVIDYQYSSVESFKDACALVTSGNKQFYINISGEYLHSYNEEQLMKEIPEILQ